MNTSSTAQEAPTHWTSTSASPTPADPISLSIPESGSAALPAPRQLQLQDILPRDTDSVCAETSGRFGDLVIFEHNKTLVAIIAEDHSAAFSIAHRKFNTREVDAVGFGNVSIDSNNTFTIGLRSLSFIHQPVKVKQLFVEVLPHGTPVKMQAL